jgi:hypothetical protein
MRPESNAPKKFTRAYVAGRGTDVERRLSRKRAIFTAWSQLDSHINFAWDGLRFDRVSRKLPSLTQDLTVYLVSLSHWPAVGSALPAG